MATGILHVWHRLILFGYWSSAFVWRRLLRRTRFVAITGSLGKTTAKELLAHVSATRWPTVKTYLNRNEIWGVLRTILSARPWHRMVVLETATSAPGVLAKLAALVRPDVAVVLLVALEHRSAFRNREAVASEKEQLALSVPRGGSVWLNGDDARVAAMRVPDGVRRRTFGSSSTFDLWASDVRGQWPDRLTFTAHFGREQCVVRTQLVGMHWLPSALAALAVSVDSGMELPEAAAALSSCPPMIGRMQPVELSSGAVLLRDDSKGGLETLQPALEVLRSSPHGRRWWVTSGFDESGLSPSVRMVRTAREVPGVADFVVFVGDHADRASRRAIRDGMPQDRVFKALTVHEAAEIVAAETRRGDLILLKGPIRYHLARVYFAQEEERFGPVGCWREDCRRRIICDVCPELHQAQPRS